MRTIPLFVIALMLLAPAALMADIGPKPRTVGPGMSPPGDMEGIEVEMTSEHVDLVLRRLGRADEAEDELLVTATFHMTNLGDDDEFEIGFPVGAVNNMRDFKASTGYGVNPGFEEHDVKLINRAAAGNRNRERRVGPPLEADGSADFWYVWNVKYPAGAKVTHVVSYRLRIFHFSEWRNTGYILHTGAAWKNNIGKAVVTLRMEGELSQGNVFSVSPRRNVEVKDGVYTWTFKDLLPTVEDDIRIEYNSETTYDQVVKDRRDNAGKYYSARAGLPGYLRDAHHRFGRAERTEAEREEWLKALGNVLRESDIKRDGDKIILPRTGPVRIHGIENLPEDIRRITEEMWKDGEMHSYAHRGGGREFVFFFRDALAGATEAPDNARALEVLKGWLEVVEALRDGNLYAGEGEITWVRQGDEAWARLRKEIAQARELLE